MTDTAAISTTPALLVVEPARPSVEASPDAPTRSASGSDVAVAGSAAAIAPWRRSWLHCAPGERATLGWVILIHAAALAGLVLLPLPTWPMLVVAVSLAFLGGLGTTIAYHRSLAHRSVTLHPLVEQPLIAFAVLNGSGNPLNWVAMHRLHHATSDRADDISSPHQGGFWWAHLRWLWQADTRRGDGMARDLASMRRYRFWARAQVPMLGLSLFGGLLWPHATLIQALTAATWVGAIRLVYCLHVQCTVNSICHLGPVTGEHGSARNVWWLALAHMGHGENWHENHHRRPGAVRLGSGWQLDIGWLLIKAMQGVRLARPRPTHAP